LKGAGVRKGIIVGLFIAFSATGLAGDRGKLTWLGFEAGIAEAKKSKKKILVDVYTDWCGWCKKMDREVFESETVAPYLRERYVLIKLNAESSAKLQYKTYKLTEAELARGFGVRSYPTVVFIDSDGEPIDYLAGYIASEQFLPIIKFVGESLYKTMSWDEYQKSGGASSPSPPKKN
jgi:thioredoxin-related protein